MEPIRKRIAIKWSDKRKRVRALCLGCFGIHRDRDGDRFVITHLPSGTSVSAACGSFETEEAALQCARSISTLCDWTSPDATTYPDVEKLKKKVEAIGRIHGGKYWFGAGTLRVTQTVNKHALRPCNETG